MPSIRTLGTVLALGSLLQAPLQADDISEQIEAAGKAYASGEWQAATQSLQFAIAAIREKIHLALFQLLPEPLEGWSADEPQATSGGMAAMIAGTHLSRHYTRPDGASAEVTITAHSPFLGMITMVLTNPMIPLDPAMRIYTHAGRHGVIQQEQGQWEIRLIGRGDLLIQVSGSDKAVAEQYLRAMDLDAVEKALADSSRLPP